MTPSALRHPLPYTRDLGLRLCRLAGDYAAPAWLRLDEGRKELFCAYPSEEIINDNNIDGLITSSKLSTDYLKRRMRGLLAGLPRPEGLEDLPFKGGLAGGIAYDAASPHPGKTGLPFPAVSLGLYTHFVVVDHTARRADYVGLPDHPETARAWTTLLGQLAATGEATPAAFSLTTPFQPLTPRPLYRQHVERIQAYLRAGDCYQVNYAQAFRAGCRGRSWGAMERLLDLSDVPYAAWMSRPEGDVLSLSPELFLHVRDGHVVTRPIKGTAPRAATPEQDAKNREELRHSPKNRAENLMIVDLLRHDLGRHAATGSVRVEKLFETESHPQVHHLASTVICDLKKESDVIDIIIDSFPGGSITGAPKRRAMEIIAELEPTPRSIYCGSLGYISCDGSAQLNIAIRTLLRTGNEIRAWAGGGIVADSDWASEYQECLDKMGALMRALEEMR